MSERGKRNFKIMMIFIFIGGLLTGMTTYFVMNAKIKEQKKQIEILEKNQAKKQGIVFENEKVAIKYYDVEAQENSYDILVETKNGTNITSEYDLKTGENSSFTYLIGRDFNTAFDFWYDNLKGKGLEWNWELNYPIERDSKK